MFHITITEDGKPVADEDTNAIAVAFNTEIGVHTMSLFDCSTDSALDTVLATNKLLSRILDNNPDLKLLFSMKDELVESEVCIDIDALERGMGK